jgi:CheY-like chemotaxis protein
MDERRKGERRKGKDRRSGEDRRRGDRRHDETPVPQERRSGRDRRERMARVLIVDDDPMTRSQLREMLERDGHRVYEASDGMEALEVLREFRADLALVDLFLPDLKGLELLAAARNEYSGLEFVALTGTAAGVKAEVARIAHALGADRVLRKPFTAVDVRKVMREAVGPGGTPGLPTEGKKRARSEG